MRSAVLVLALCCTAAPALAQPTLSITPSTYILSTIGGTTTVQIEGGMPLMFYALVGSSTNSKAGSTYTISHAGQFPIPAVVPSVTVTGGATVTSLLSTADQTVVTLSADAAFWFTLQPVRR